MTPFAVELSVCIGVGGCRCPISVSMFLRWTASFAFLKSPLSSASAAEDMMAFMIFAMLRMAPLFGGMSALVDKKNVLLLYYVPLVRCGSLRRYGL